MFGGRCRIRTALSHICAYTEAYTFHRSPFGGDYENRTRMPNARYILVGPVGFEPTVLAFAHTGLKVRCLQPLDYDPLASFGIRG